MPNVPTSHPTPDPLMETQLFWVRNKMSILVGFTAILLALAAYGAYEYYSARRDAAAAGALAEGKTAENYQKVIADYPSTPAGQSAYLLLAAEQRKADKFADANATLQKFLDQNPKHELVTTAKMGIAANLEALGHTDEALDTYRRLAADYPTDFNAPLAMLEQVPLLKRAGKTDEARKVCETILTQYRESYASAEATQQLRQLKPAELPASPQAVSPVIGDPNAPPAQNAGGAVTPAPSTAPTP